MKQNNKNMLLTSLLLTFLLKPVQICQAAESVSQVLHRLEPELRARAAALRQLAVPLDDPQFQRLVEEAIRQRVPVHAEGLECRAHSLQVVEAVMSAEPWALRMFDASTKLPRGLLDWSLVDLGNFHECLGSEEPNSLFTGQHCLVETRGILPTELLEFTNFDLSDVPADYSDIHRYFLLTDVTFSVCVPSSCAPRDVQVHMDRVLSSINATSIVHDSSCSTVQPPPLRTMDYAAISVFLGILTIVVCCTLRDTLSSGPKSAVVAAFSLPRNWTQLTATEVTGPGDIPCLHGLRVLSTAGIVLAHRATALLLTPDMLRSKFDIVESVLLAILENLLRGVDVFFMIGGTVRAYTFFRDRYKGRQLDVLPSIARRYFRYTPTLMVVILYTATLRMHSGTGPKWKRSLEYTAWCCQRNWILNVLQIQNYIYPLTSCVGESWYLAADFQLFVFSPLMLIPLYFRPRLGKILLAVTGLGTLAVYWTTCSVTEIDACSFTMVFNRTNEFVTGHYFQAHLRAPAYLLGLGLGYLLFTVAQTNQRPRLPKVLLWLGWSLSLVMLVVVVVATKVVMAADHRYDLWVDTPINAVSKFLVAAIAAWIVLICTLGQAEGVNRFLSWGGFQPLSRLTLGVYLVHLGLISIPHYARLTTPIEVDQVTLVYQWLSDLVLASTVAVPLYLCVELPCCHLANHYFITPVPYDPIIASLSVKRPRVENNVLHKTYQPVVPSPATATSSRKVKKKSKK